MKIKQDCSLYWVSVKPLVQIKEAGRSFCWSY